MLTTDAVVDLSHRCAPAVHVLTVKALVQQESGGNPFAIGVVGGRLIRQPRNSAEAVATARSLEAAGWNYSIGLTQINRSNFVRLGIGIDSGFDPCANLRAMQAVLHECWQRAKRHSPDADQAVRASLACYYSGSLATTRYGNYVGSVVAHARSARAALCSTAAGGSVNHVAQCAINSTRVQ